jgi:hypothetical protein
VASLPRRALDVKVALSWCTTLWWGSQRFSNPSMSAGILARMRPLANPASLSGLVSPSMRASTIARADLDHTRDATDHNLIPASCFSFSSRWISWPRAVIWVLRYRVSSRSARIGGVARNSVAPSHGRPRPRATTGRRAGDALRDPVADLDRARLAATGRHRHRRARRPPGLRIRSRVQPRLQTHDRHLPRRLPPNSSRHRPRGPAAHPSLTPPDRQRRLTPPRRPAGICVGPKAYGRWRTPAIPALTKSNSQR